MRPLLATNLGGPLLLARAQQCAWEERGDDVDHLELNPVAYTRSELYDAYQDQIARTTHEPDV
jgi:hypothetical protein